MKKMLVWAALVLAALSAEAVAQTNLNGAGATFPAPLYTKWFDEYSNITGVKVNYQPVQEAEKNTKRQAIAQVFLKSFQRDKEK